VYPEAQWFRISTPSDIDALLERHIRDGEQLPALRLPDTEVAD
jgi:(2Fe-2S) ferredoxin